ncbi:OB-fold domain-containing protein [Bradyrhizobium cenepequi]|uniref:OB-fold domain-containing protein n=1 Tax=Bradyrhizobium cenepequi TaxID=2821403 RepID=UPI001CE2F7B0|nr:OB-fold domain-containing protein [Bradyrhizobium cenepequi]
MIASAKVHLHNPTASVANTDVIDRETPFTIGSMKLDDGPTIRTLMVDADERALKPGQRMVSKLVPIGRSAQTIVDLRFTPAS